MILKNINHSCSYQTEKIALTFLPLEKLGEDNGNYITTEYNNGVVFVDAQLFSKKIHKENKIKQNEDIAHAISVLLFEALSELTGFKPPWGILYGVRPARLMHSRAERFSEE
ncbi:MAG: hypothetical protein IJ927_05800, partial [Eubacterium sp.]|nr:hypothetical protein [Eubacterium sp.]